MKASKYGIMGVSPESVSKQENSRLAFHSTHAVISMMSTLAQPAASHLLYHLVNYCHYKGWNEVRRHCHTFTARHKLG